MMNLHAIARHLPLRDGAHRAHADAEHRLAGDLDLALFRRVRRRRSDRASREIDGVSYGAFIVPGPDHAVAADAEHLERVVRHLLSKVHRHDLRAPVGAGFLSSRSSLGYVGAAATKSIILGADHSGDRGRLFVPLQIEHPFVDDRRSCCSPPSPSACSASSSASGRTASRNCSSFRC